MMVQIHTDNERTIALFRLPAQIWADRINLVGDFNGWNTNATPMRLGEQYWETTVSLPQGSTSYYAYLIDGMEWCSEYLGPQNNLNTTTASFVPIEVLHARERSELALAVGQH